MSSNVEKDTSTCRLCGNATAKVVPGYGTQRVSCPRCGEFGISFEAAEEWAQRYRARLNPRALANAAGWVRSNPGIVVGLDDLERLAKLPSPSVQDRAERILRELEARTKELGVPVPITPKAELVIDWLGIGWCSSSRELDYLVQEYLAANGYVQRDPRTPALMATVTPRGFAYLEELRTKLVESNIGFCAMWFDPRMDPVWNDAIEPAIAAARYDPRRIDRVDHNNKIDDEIVAMLRKCRFVVADFTGQRGGVYFEAGFALGLGRPVIWTVADAELSAVHFDTRQYNFISWKPEALGELRTRLQARIEATIGQGSRTAQ